MTRADEFTRLLYLSAGYTDGNEARSHISGLEHALRVASLAKRYDSEDVELHFAALVHDLARPLSDEHHGEVMAEMVRNLVRGDIYMMLKNHGFYQSEYIHGGDVVSTPLMPWDRISRALCAWEIRSFLPDWSYPTMTFPEGLDLINEVIGDRT